MQLEASFRDGMQIVRIVGDIDHHETLSLREDIDKLLIKNHPDELVFDLSDTDFMDSSGLGLILGRLRKANDMGCSVRVINPTERINKVLKLAGVDKLINIERIG